jgi:hypothetical protein
MEKILHAGPGLVIGIPTLGRPVPIQWAFAFKSLNPPINYNVNVHVVTGKPVADARNEIAKSAVERKAKYIFFLGDDVVCPGHTLRQLIYRLENNPQIDVVGGVYCAKADPSYPLVFRGNGHGSYWDWKIGEFFEVTGLGMDCTLIRTEVLEKLTEPWFVTVDKDQSLDGINNSEQWTEDLFFFNKLGEEVPDSKVYCDATVICEHWDVYGSPPRYYSLPLDSLPMRRIMLTVVGKKKRLVLGNPVPDDSDYITVRFHENDEKADYRGDYSSLPFNSGEFDCILCDDTLSHSAKIVEEMKRVSKKAA